MKKKIVLWGNDENEKKVLVALELKAEENQVNVYTFSEEQATEEFYNLMMNDWRMGKEVTFPEGHNVSSNPLSLTDELLPENIKVLRTDVISRAKAEWHFVVLSEKLYDMYKTELEDIKEKVDQLVDFDGGLWDEMKQFWAKINEQIREKNLFREQATKLKDQTNALFNQLKELRNKANEQFSELSKQKYEEYKTRLDEIEEKVEKGLGLNPIFNELKDIQAKFKDEKMTRGDSNRLWKNIDVLFKKVKEKKFGKPVEGAGGSNASRLERRYNGLLGAIEKMQRSIDRDRKDIEFQNRRVNETDGQLEMQIRQAKVKMIEERINSKDDKLKEMLATKSELEAKLKKEEERVKVKEEKKEIQKKKKEVKEKIAAEIAEKSASMDDEKLQKAASQLKSDDKPKDEEPVKKESLLGAITAVAGEALENVVDTVKAVGEVVGDKIEDKLEDVKETLKEVKEEIAEEITEVKDAVVEKADEVKEKSDDDSVLKKSGAMATAAAAGSMLVDKIKETVAEAKEEISEKVTEVKEAVAEKMDASSEIKSEEE